ncbi:Oligopeptide-binding protein AppA [bacterium HR29]|jgi:peptide/nickel transport system substrate-binding protein|nr:Oligopeptide-binding protein AppA [bacterium HR29]
MARRPARWSRLNGSPALVLGAALFLAAAASLAALALQARDGDGGLLPGLSEYTEAVPGTWQRINPIYASLNEPDQDLVALLFSGLVRLAPDGRVEPDLAEALPSVSADGRTYTFRLRPGLKWHDGQPVTSYDVAFTIRQVVDPGFRGDPLLAEAWQSVRVETPDERTVVFELDAPSAPFLARYATIGVLPEHLLRGLTADQLYDAPFNAAPVGTGPYRLVSLSSSEAVLEANSDYHLGRPRIGRIRLVFVSDVGAGVRLFQSGRVDGVLLRDPLPESQRVQLERMSGVRILTPQRAAYLVLYLNNAQANTFADVRVRQAISLALDREAIVAEALGGAGTPSASPIAPGSWAYVSELDRRERDLERARRLLEEAGWRPHPTMGTLVKEGAEFRVTIRTDNDPTRIAVADAVARQLDELGIRATVASTTFAVLRRDFLQQRRYEIALAGWEQGPDPDPYFAWHSTQMGTAGLNIANFSDAVVDRLIETARTTLDEEVRRDMYRQLQEVWQDVVPSAIIAYPRYTYLLRSGVEAKVPDLLASPSQRFASIAEWSR